MLRGRSIRAVVSLAALAIAILSGCARDSDNDGAAVPTAPVCAAAAYGAGPIPALLPASSGERRYVATSGHDRNAGTEAQPWASIQHALDAARPGDQILVRAGAYEDESLGPDRGDGVGHSINASPRGTPDAPITLSPHPGEQVTLRGFITLPEAAYFRLTGFVIDGHGAHPGAEGVSLGNTADGPAPEGVEISYNEITGFRPTEGAGAYGILHFSGRNNVLMGNRIHDVGSRYPYHHGIYLASGENVVVANNVVYDIEGGYGIHIWGDVDRAFVIHNTVVNNAASGITVGGNEVRGHPDGIHVAGNILAEHRVTGDPDQADPHEGYAIKEYLVGERSEPAIDNVYSDNIAWDNGRGEPYQIDQGVTIDNREEDPRFVEAEAHDFRLSPGSPAIGSVGDLGVTRDADAHVRDGCADAGALEHR